MAVRVPAVCAWLGLFRGHGDWPAATHHLLRAGKCAAAQLCALQPSPANRTLSCAASWPAMWARRARAAATSLLTKPATAGSLLRVCCPHETELLAFATDSRVVEMLTGWLCAHGMST